MENKPDGTIGFKMSRERVNYYFYLSLNVQIYESLYVMMAGQHNFFTSR